MFLPPPTCVIVSDIYGPKRCQLPRIPRLRYCQIFAVVSRRLRSQGRTARDAQIRARGNPSPHVDRPTGETRSRGGLYTHHRKNQQFISFSSSVLKNPSQSDNHIPTVTQPQEPYQLSQTPLPCVNKDNIHSYVTESPQGLWTSLHFCDLIGRFRHFWFSVTKGRALDMS